VSNDGYPSKKWLFIRCWHIYQIGTDILLIITITGDELFRNVNIDDLE